MRGFNSRIDCNDCVVAIFFLSCFFLPTFLANTNITDDFFVGDHPNLMRKVSIELTINILNKFKALLVPNLVFLHAATGSERSRVRTKYKRLRGSPISVEDDVDSKTALRPIYPDFGAND